MDITDARPGRRPSASGRAAGLSRTLAQSPWIAPLVVASVVAVAVHAAGSAALAEDSLGQMGFDPDRATLIAGLILEFLVVAGGVAVAGTSASAVVPGMATLGLTFGPTFADETASALASNGPTAFDPLGWALTAATVVAIGLLLGLATLVLVGRARGLMLGSASDLLRAGRARDRRMSLVRPLGILVCGGLAVAALATFGDMVNYTPDIHMLRGASLGRAADPTPTEMGAGQGPTPTPSAIYGQPGVMPATGYPAPTSASRPWLEWRPSGVGTVISTSLPGPWTGGTPAATLTIYLPAGYDGGGRRYPVLYEVPWGPGGWIADVHVFQQLDALISSGAIPPQIAVLVSSGGSPIPDTECINSADGRVWFERYLVDSVVPYIDGHYRSIRTVAARALIGMSQGGYCASMLLLRHADVFSSAISFSGYYAAAIRSSQTPNARLPYGGDTALIAATSPILELGSLSAVERRGLFLELSANPSSPFYGPQYRAFADAAHRDGIALALFPAATGHSWATVRDQLPEVLGALAAREVVTGVFN